MPGFDDLHGDPCAAEGLRLAWPPIARATLLTPGGTWSLLLTHRRLTQRVNGFRRVLFLSAFAIAVAGVPAAWAPIVYRVL